MNLVKKEKICHEGILSMKNIESKLRSLDKDILNTLACALRIKFKYPFRRKSDIVEAILSNPEYKKVAEKYLEIIPQMEASDETWLREFADELGLKESSLENRIASKAKSKLVRKILEKTDSEEFVRKMMPASLTLIILGGFGFTFLFSFMPEPFSLFAGAVSIIALLFGLATYIYPRLILKETVVLTRGELIYRIFLSTVVVVLLIFTFFSYPDRAIFLGDWGNIATVTGFLMGWIFFYFDRAVIIIWAERYVDKVIWSIILMMGITFIYNYVFTVKGNVYFLDNQNKPVNGATITIQNSEFQKWVCGWMWEPFKESMRLCETETNKEGNFFIRVFSFKKEKTKIWAKYNENSADKFIGTGNKNVTIGINKIEGEWECNCKDKGKFWWSIRRSDGKLFIREINKNDEINKYDVSFEEKRSFFFSYCFYNKVFRVSESTGIFLHQVKAKGISEDMVDKVELIQTNGELEVIFFLKGKKALDYASIHCNR